MNENILTKMSISELDKQYRKDLKPIRFNKRGEAYAQGARWN